MGERRGERGRGKGEKEGEYGEKEGGVERGTGEEVEAPTLHLGSPDSKRLPAACSDRANAQRGDFQGLNYLGLAPRSRPAAPPLKILWDKRGREQLGSEQVDFSWIQGKAWEGALR